MDLQKLVGGLSKSGALSGFLGGVAGGGLTGMMSGKKSKKVGKSALKVGALAAVGGIAWKAYQQYSNKQNQGHASHQQASSFPPQNTQQSSARFNFTPATIPQQAFEEVVEDTNVSGQMLLMRAMITAAYADGHIDDNERSRIFAQVETMDLSMEEKAMLFDELRKPLSVTELVNAVPDSQTGIEVYAASASAIDIEQQASQTYLNQLASQLCIPTELQANIHQQLAGS
ncbi:tellurite resistance TerB family protein [Agaribacter flavus]|uniref:Tellurite resistance TerB family protein n=1 Tax=Agaribacter flavus TaxID=1902781 RepID=A0ABV7FRN3_9ALTE